MLSKVIYLYAILLLTMINSCRSQTVSEEDAAQYIKEMMEKQKENSKAADKWPISNAYRQIEDIEFATLTPIYNIGDCLVTQLSDSTFIGIMIYGISQTSSSIAYELAFSGRPFKELPSFTTLKNAGIVGQLIPSTSEWVVGFCISTVSDSLLKQHQKDFRFIENIPIAQVENRIHRGGFISNLEEITGASKRILAEKKDEIASAIMPQKSPEILPVDYLIKAGKELSQKKPVFYWELSYQTAHPEAQKLMKEDWWYSSSYDFSPLGNDDGHDAFYGFRSWRKKNAKIEPSRFFLQLEEEWETTFAQKRLTEYEEIKKAKQQNILYGSIDYAIIGVAFAQLILEGEISADLKEYALKAIKRQYLLIENDDYQYEKELKKERITTFHKQMQVLKSANSPL
jgi:uncharacterized protein YfeS